MSVARPMIVGRSQDGPLFRRLRESRVEHGAFSVFRSLANRPRGLATAGAGVDGPINRHHRSRADMSRLLRSFSFAVRKSPRYRVGAGCDHQTIPSGWEICAVRESGGAASPRPPAIDVHPFGMCGCTKVAGSASTPARRCGGLVRRCASEVTAVSFAQPTVIARSPDGPLFRRLRESKVESRAWRA